MADLKCNKGSGDGGGARDLRFSYIFCNCKKVALIQIVTNQAKSAREKLYFVCESKEYCFFKWCKPIHEVEASSSSTSVGGSDFEGFTFNLSELKDKIEKLVNVVPHCLSFVIVVTIVCVFK